jgi:XrtN system VIT domain protein
MEETKLAAKPIEVVESSKRENFLLGQDTLTILGFFLLLLSSGIFYLKIGQNSEQNGLFNGSFVINFCISIGYSIGLISNGLFSFFWKKKKTNSTQHALISWSIWIMSCFALNRDMRVFYESSDWLSVAVCISLIINCLYAFKDSFPKKLTSIYYFIFSISAILWGYFAIYLIPLYPVSVIGLLFLGISIHSYIPLFLSIALIRILVKVWDSQKKSILISWAFTVFFLAWFISIYHVQTNEIKHFETQALVSKTDEVPLWVKIAQHIDDDWVTERVLKSDLVYQKFMSDNISFFPETNLQALFRHDPLVLLASAISPSNNISQDERIKILESRFDARHDTEERLWSGENLSIPSVSTQAKVYPQYRLAYTEKTIDIHNSGERSNWNTEEGIFTFYVPEGTAVTSLSLWIGGKEQKGILTTQGKADSAYRSIVGVERRDPSVLHWQEGNRLNVRVFPCTPTEDRSFKIGFTSPLRFDSETNKLTYQNIYFKGPSIQNTKESTFIDFDKSVAEFESDRRWDEVNTTKITDEGSYKSDWKMTFDAPKLAETTFSFHGKNYQLFDYIAENESVIIKNIYLDIDKTWKKKDVEKILQMAVGKRVWIWNQGMVLLNNDNFEEQFEELSKQEFSLFPVTFLKNIEDDLLITKSATSSPILKDLGESNLRKSFEKNTQTAPLKTFVLDELSPYLKTLEELRIIRCQYGDFQQLESVIRDNKFVKNIENQTVSIIKSSKIGIREAADSSKNDAPDHLLRLFAYNQVLKEIGHSYFDKNSLQDSLISTAALGNVVTPISSLIVLETQADYDRFGIKKDQNGLDNATFNKAGAVPEPHEWALILLVLLFGVFHFRSKIVKLWA